ncbi:DUF2628 domain-containing protein [Rhodoblastus sp.]|uniref:DUF2628 domain-containing protein n=1 Tax=Rhodoblastus sp. TaxID=1962975 RepID=UPI003F9D4CB4
MNLYAVFLPADDGDLERAAFVKQGFSREAFLLTPFWAARKKLWGALAMWLAWAAIAAGLAWALKLNADVAGLVYLIGAFAFGLEGESLEQSRLTKSGFALQALALGGSRREAEEIFFEGPAKDLPPPAPEAGDEPAPPAASAGAIDLLGLFHPGN